MAFFKKKEKTGIDLRIEQLEQAAWTQDDGLTPAQYRELVSLEKVRNDRKKGDREKAAIWSFLGSVLAASVGAIGLIYRVKKITRYEDDEHYVSSKAGNERY